MGEPQHPPFNISTKTKGSVLLHKFFPNYIWPLNSHFKRSICISYKMSITLTSPMCKSCVTLISVLQAFEYLSWKYSTVYLYSNKYSSMVTCSYAFFGSSFLYHFHNGRIGPFLLLLYFNFTHTNKTLNPLVNIYKLLDDSM